MVRGEAAAVPSSTKKCIDSPITNSLSFFVSYAIPLRPECFLKACCWGGKIFSSFIHPVTLPVWGLILAMWFVGQTFA